MKAELLQKYISGNASEAEMQRVIEWIKEDDEHLHEYMAQRKLFDISLWNSEVIKKRKNRLDFSLKVIFIEAMKIAAVIAFTLLGTYFWINRESEECSQMQSIYAPAGQRSEIVLSDGTKVWLNARSRLTFPLSFDRKKRKVKLDGEGYFVVAKNKKKPFIVETSKYNIRVLGTEFNVMAYSSNNIWTASLLKGSIEVYGTHMHGIMKLEPTTMAVYKNNRLVKSVITDTECFRWREGLIYFKDVSIKEMLDKLKLYYGVNIIVNNVKILSNHYTGKFWVSDGIEHVFKVLKLDNKFTYIKDDDKNLIIID